MDSSSDEAWTDRVDMGSLHKFSQHICDSCGDSSFLHNYGRCSDCEHANAHVAAIPCITFKHLLHTVNLPETVMDTLVSYLIPDPEDSLITFRKEYLKKMLLGWSAEMDWTLFRMLTWHTNGMAGSISAREDVLDRILEFSHGAGYRPNRGYRELWGPR